MYQKIQNIKKTRKPSTDYINTTDWNKLTNSTQLLIKSLERYTTNLPIEKYDNENTPQFILLISKSKIYLVDKQGYSYMRYATELTNVALDYL